MIMHMATGNNSENDHEHHHHAVNFASPREFHTKFKSTLREMFFLDDPFSNFNFTKVEEQTKPLLIRKLLIKGVQCLVPMFQWLPNYTRRLFFSDLLAGLTVTALAVPLCISFATIAHFPPVLGLYSSFVPPLVYAVFGSSRHLSVGTVASLSLVMYQTISTVANPEHDLKLYLHLVFTATFVAASIQTGLGIFRLGLLLDFLSHSTITGFVGATALLICVQQLKGIFGIKHVSSETDLVAMIKGIFTYGHEIKWQPTVLGLFFLAFLQFTKYIKKRKPKLFWVSALGPLITIIVAAVFTHLVDGQRHGIQIVSRLERGMNPLSIQHFNFDSKYFPAILKCGIITGLLSLTEGISTGRSFSVAENTPHNGHKEMIAIGLMNLCGSFTSCYVTSGPISKTAVNYNAGCKTAMSNIVQAFLMVLTLEFLTPLLGYTPVFALSAITISAMIGLINYREVMYLYKVDPFDFGICMVAFFGVTFIAPHVGLMLSVGLSMIRALISVARPLACRLGKLPEKGLYRDIEQYPATTFPGILIVQLGSPIHFANSNYIKERLMRYVESQQESTGDTVAQIILDLSGVTSIDTTAIKGLFETYKIFEKNGIKMSFVNPRLEVLEKLITSKFVDKIGREAFFLTLNDAVKASEYSLRKTEAAPEANSV